MNGRYFLTSKALAGYMTTGKGRQLVFAIYLNDVQLNTLEEVFEQGRVLARLTELMYQRL